MRLDHDRNVYNEWYLALVTWNMYNISQNINKSIREANAIELINI